MPLAALAFCVAILATCLLASRVLHTVSGALVPAIGWIAASFVLSMPVASGSVIITNTAAGKWYLYGGTLCAVGGVILASLTRVRPRCREQPRGEQPRGEQPRRRPNDVDAASFRRAAGQFASGIVVVTTRGGHAMTVSAFTSVSLAPPLVLFCAEKIARFHDAVCHGGLVGGVHPARGRGEDRALAGHQGPPAGRAARPGGASPRPGHRRAGARPGAGRAGMPDHRRARRRRSQHRRRPGRRRPQDSPIRPSPARWSTTPAPTGAWP